MIKETGKVNYCPLCGAQCVGGICPTHGLVVLGQRLEVCLNGHIIREIR